MFAPRVTRDAAAGRVLTARQLEVLTLVARGLSTDNIADELFLTPNTIRRHVRHILDRLGARNRPHAVAIAFSVGLISIDDYAD
jgi:DNA-binding NarL/FixJ family response regulator